MLAIHGQSKIVTRLYTDPAGREFKLTFLLTLSNGSVRAQLLGAELISAKPLELAGEVTNHNYVLPFFCQSVIPCAEFAATFIPVASPYFSLEFLINSQPTRAPANR